MLPGEKGASPSLRVTNCQAGAGCQSGVLRKPKFLMASELPSQMMQSPASRSTWGTAAFRVYCPSRLAPSFPSGLCDKCYAIEGIALVIGRRLELQIVNGRSSTVHVLPMIQHEVAFGATFAPGSTG